MSWNFRRRVKVAPGVYVNISKNGVSTSIGPRGAKITMGNSGTYINTGIPGTGVYRRTKIGGTSSETKMSVPNKSSRHGGGCAPYIISWFVWCFILFVAMIFALRYEWLEHIDLSDVELVIYPSVAIICLSILTGFIFDSISRSSFRW